MGKKAHASVVAAVATAGALVCVLVGATSPPDARLDAVAKGQTIESRLRERAAALASRVSTLSELPRLAAAVATDANTVRDLTSEELAFRPGAAEIISIDQLFHDGRRVPLLTLPKGAPHGEAVAPGLHTSLDRGRLVMSQTGKIAPAQRAEELSGLLTVTWPLDAKEISSGVVDPSTSARLILGRETMWLGAASPPSEPRLSGSRRGDNPGLEASAPVHLPGQPSLTATLAINALGPAGDGFRFVWWIGAGLFGLIASIGWLRLAIGPRPIVKRPASGSTPSGEIAWVSTVPGVSAPSSFPVVDIVSFDPGDGTPQRIGRYSIVRLLGQGGMAEVFLARAEGEAGFGKLVAVKVLQAAFAANPAVVGLFLDEARLVAGLDHPNIVQTHDLGRAGDRYFIAMEYVEGTDLAKLMAIVRQLGERVPIRIALGILCRICDGLHAAHVAVGPDGKPLSLVHRDVKSANIFVSRGGTVKIGDFGVAKATHAVRVSRTEIGLVKGTPGYMAPEQRLGMDVDCRSDLYGVAAIAYELLSGAPVNLDFVALAARGTAGWPHLLPLSVVREDVPPELDALITQSLSYEPHRRPANCAELERALRVIAISTGLADDKEIGVWTRAQLGRGSVTMRAVAASSES